MMSARRASRTCRAAAGLVIGAVIAFALVGVASMLGMHYGLVVVETQEPESCNMGPVREPTWVRRRPFPRTREWRGNDRWPHEFHDVVILCHAYLLEALLERDMDVPANFEEWALEELHRRVPDSDGLVHVIWCKRMQVFIIFSEGMDGWPLTWDDYVTVGKVGRWK